MNAGPSSLCVDFLLLTVKQHTRARAPCNRVAATYDYHTKNAQTAAKRSAQNDKRAPNPATTTVESAVAAPRFLMRWNVLGAQLTAVYGLA